MFDSLPDFVANLLTAFLFFCGVSAIISVVAIYWVWRQINHYTAPDVSKLNAQFQKIKSSSKKTSDGRALRKIINQQAFKSGMVGAITSFGGFYTLPIALPVDIVLSTRIQSTMVEFIAQHYGHSASNDVENRLKTYIVTTGTVTLTERSSTFLLSYGVRILQKSFPKFVPILGALIGFAVNYTIARSTGAVAVQWYAKNRKSIAPST
ncbi:MAG: hypothetical protein RLP44_13470 [Aggregatilineales bacterium]